MMRKKKEQLYESENMANAVRYNLEYTFEEIVKEMNDIYVNREINSFLNEQYKNGYEFYAASVELSKKRPSICRAGMTFPMWSYMQIMILS